jgi:hypothetical protein
VWRASSGGIASCRTPPRRHDLWTARVLDVSRGGIALLVRERFAPGTVLAVRPLGAAAGSPAPPPARVVRAVAQANGLWLLGCRFLGELTEAQLESFGLNRTA